MRRTTRRKTWMVLGLMAGVGACGDELPPVEVFDGGPPDAGCPSLAPGMTFSSDPANCGACGTTCAEGEVCRRSRCDSRPETAYYAPCSSDELLCPGRCIGIGTGGPRVCASVCDLASQCAPSTLGGTARPVCQPSIDYCLLVCNVDGECPAGMSCRRPTATSVAGVCAR